MSHITDDIIRICRDFAALERESVCCGGVTVSQCFALQALLVDGEMTVSDLSSRLGGSVSATTRLVDGLVKREYLQRKRDANDKRRRVVSLTDEGRDEARSLRSMTELMVERCLQRIPAAKRDAVAEAIALIRAAMESASQEGVDLTCCAPSETGGASCE